MRVLISGGGIAGMTLAYWLRRAGMTPVVIEQADGLRRDGYAIDFFGAAYDVAERMNLITWLEARAIPLEAICLVNRSGRTFAAIDRALLGRVTGGKYLALMHATLEEALYEALAGQVEVRFGRLLASVQASDQSVAVTFNDGTSDSFDLLIGADGLHSRTRDLIFEPEERYRRFLGYMVACFSLADRYGIGRCWKMYNEPGRMVGAYVGEREGEFLTFLMYHMTEPERHAPGERLSRLRQAFAGMAWIAPDLLADVADTDRIYLDTVSQIHMPAWARGRVVLVGDACGCPTLISGQGASLAMAGSYLLAEALRECGTYQEAFARYEARARPHVERCQARARGLRHRLITRSEQAGVCATVGHGYRASRLRLRSDRRRMGPDPAPAAA